ncbi:hypothetical protein P280DRAFT_464695 [Massarina eburnea CBS 473.64]|uniref:Uncharacterized protein n=1 Tax=Massarina eburnea CBS 473.64 TaxID=1395130 RepID=A0A6A6SHS0_9PLEO|nr:hypothetical protein P280DRAFT_464695 [Massarina eburnea CBS 473.64]
MDEDAKTLIGLELRDGEEGKLREGDVVKEIEVSDYDGDSEREDEEDGMGMDRGCGLRRKRTIRVVIRSRAFL